MKVELLGYHSMRKTVNKAFINLVSFIFGHDVAGIIFSYQVFVDRELRPLVVKIQCVGVALAIATEIHVPIFMEPRV